MAEEIDIQEEFEDDSDSSLTDRMRRRPGGQSPSGVPFQPGVTDRGRIQEVEAAIREQEKRRKEQQREADKQRKQMVSDQQRQLKQQQRREQKQSKETVRQARSDAISGRVQAYGLGFALGFPGYVFGSVVDFLALRPREQETSRREMQYQEDLRNYYKGLEDDQRMADRQREEDLKNYPIDATPLDQFGNVQAPPPGQRPPPPPPGAPPGGQQPGPPPRNQPPRIKPQQPAASGGRLAALGAATAGPAAIATGVIVAAKKINEGVKSFGQQASQLGQAVGSGDATQSLRAGSRFAQSMVDPLGLNVPLTVAVEGFNALLDTNAAILENIKQNSAFAPQTLQADVEGEILRLAKQIETSQKLDSINSQLVRANTQMELAFADLRAEIIEELGPKIVVILHAISKGIDLMTKTIDYSFEALKYLPGVAGQLFQVLDAIFDVLAASLDSQAKDIDASDIPAQIERFFNVPLQVGKMAPGAVPNP